MDSSPQVGSVFEIQKSTADDITGDVIRRRRYISFESMNLFHILWTNCIINELSLTKVER